METFVQPKITGYRQLNEAEAALMNEIKAEGVKLGELVAKLRATEGLDQRWVSIGATDLQTGLMALTRGVAQPTRSERGSGARLRGPARPPQCGRAGYAPEDCRRVGRAGAKPALQLQPGRVLLRMRYGRPLRAQVGWRRLGK